MSLEQEGLYHRMLNLSWRIGPLPFDVKTLSKLLILNPKTFRKLWINPLVTCWLSTDNGLVNPKLEEERVWSKSKSDKGLRGAGVRWKEDALAYASADALASPGHTPGHMPQRCDLRSLDPPKTPDPVFPGSSSSKSSSSRSRSSKPKKEALSEEGGEGLFEGELPDAAPPSDGEKSWLATGVSWAQFRMGAGWDRGTNAVVLTDQAGGGLREHLEALANLESLTMMTDAQLQQGWGKLNTHLISFPFKRNKKTLPGLVRGWCENDLRTFSAWEKKNGRRWKTKHEAHLEELDEFIERKYGGGGETEEAESALEVDTLVGGGDAEDGGLAGDLGDGDLGQDAD